MLALAETELGTYIQDVSSIQPLEYSMYAAHYDRVILPSCLDLAFDIREEYCRRGG